MHGRHLRRHGLGGRQHEHLTSRRRPRLRHQHVVAPRTRRHRHHVDLFQLIVCTDTPSVCVRVFVSITHIHTRLFNAIFQDNPRARRNQNVSVLDSTDAKDDGGGGDNWCRAIAKLQSSRHHQQANTQLFTRWTPFLSFNQQCQSTDGEIFCPNTSYHRQLKFN